MEPSQPARRNLGIKLAPHEKAIELAMEWLLDNHPEDLDEAVEYQYLEFLYEEDEDDFIDSPDEIKQLVAINAYEWALAEAVMRPSHGVATLMELVVPSDDGLVARSVLSAAIDVALESGCERIQTFASSSWRHWPLLHAVGFASRPSEHYVFLRLGLSTDPDPDDWQLYPGINDSF